MGLKELLSGKSVTKRFITQNGYEVVAVYDRKDKEKFEDWGTLKKSSIKHVNTSFDSYKRELYANGTIIPLTDEFKECRKVKAAPFWTPGDFKLTVNKDGSYHVRFDESAINQLQAKERDYDNGYKAADDLLNSYKKWYIKNYDADAEFDVRFEDFKAEVFTLIGDNELSNKTRIQKDFQNWKDAKAHSERNRTPFYAASEKYKDLENLLNYRENYEGTENYIISTEDERALRQYEKNEKHVEAVTMEMLARREKLERKVIFNTNFVRLSNDDLKGAMKDVSDFIYKEANKLPSSVLTAFMAEKGRALLKILGIRFEIGPSRGNTGNIGEVGFYDWKTGDGITFCSIKDHEVDNRLPSESPECWDLDGKRSFADDRIQKVIDAYKKRKLETGEVKEMKADPEPAKNVGRIIPKGETDKAEFGRPDIIAVGFDSKEPAQYGRNDNLCRLGDDNSGGGRDDR